MKYVLLVGNSFDKSLRKLSSDVAEHIENVVFQLEDNPRAGEQLKGEFRHLWSLHTKLDNVQYRVIYSLDTIKREVMLHYASSRENFYKEVKRLRLKVP